MRSLFAGLALCLIGPVNGQDVRNVLRSEVAFISEAPMERISATSTACSGVIDVQQRTFAIVLPVRTFEGFNSPLQREHFNENYLESGKFPSIIFEGRIIESIDLSRPGTYKVRAKGEFTVHGVTHERIIEALCVVTPDGIRVNSLFTVLLSDHAIRVPRVVQQKVASNVQVHVDLRFGPKRGAVK